MTPRPLTLLCASVLTSVRHTLHTVRTKGRPKKPEAEPRTFISRLEERFLSTYEIPRGKFIDLRNLLTSPPYNSVERPIQYGTQFDLACGVNCNVYYSEKRTTLKVHIQNKEADINAANMLEFSISTMESA